MQEFLEAAVKKYENLAQPLVAVKHSQGQASKLFPVRSATTPFVSDDQRESPAGAPGDDNVTKYPWCGNALHYQPECVYDSVAQFVHSELARKKQLPECKIGQLIRPPSPDGSPSNSSGAPEGAGVLAPIACKVLA